MNKKLESLIEEIINESIDYVRSFSDFADKTELSELFNIRAKEYLENAEVTELYTLLDMSAQSLVRVLFEMSEIDLNLALQKSGTRGLLEMVVLNMMMDWPDFESIANDIVTVQEFIEEVQFLYQCASDDNELVITFSNLQQFIAHFCQMAVDENSYAYGETLQMHKQLIIQRVTALLSNTVL